MVFVKHNHALKRRYKRIDTIDHILLQEVDERNEWLIGMMDGNSSNDENDDLVFKDDDLTWNVVSQAACAEDPIPSYFTRGTKGLSSSKAEREENWK